MMVDTKNLVSIAEANGDFSKVIQLVDQNGPVVILRDDAPRYLVIDLTRTDTTVQDATEKEVMEISERLIAKNRKAYEELAK